MPNLKKSESEDSNPHKNPQGRSFDFKMPDFPEMKMDMDFPEMNFPTMDMADAMKMPDMSMSETSGNAQKKKNKGKNDKNPPAKKNSKTKSKKKPQKKKNPKNKPQKKKNSKKKPGSKGIMNDMEKK